MAYGRRRLGLDLEAKLVEEFDPKAVADWLVRLLRERGAELEPGVSGIAARAAGMLADCEPGRCSHALRALARSLSGKGTDYEPGTLRRRAEFDVLERLLQGPESFEGLLAALHGRWLGESDAADLAERLSALAAGGLIDAGLVRPGLYQALGRVEPARLLAKPAAYHFSLTRAGTDAWADYRARHHETTPPARGAK